MTGYDVTTSFARTLVDEWVRAGIDYAVVAPGSRNTPITLALERDGRLTVDVVLDERSAAFRALGYGLATRRPAIVCCTSGTAAANFLPAVVEAHQARVPLLVVTADRPPELRDVGAPQTIDQSSLYGRAVRWFHDPGPPDATPSPGAANARWRAFAARAAAAAAGPPAGPVHCNLPLREPLVPSGEALLDAPGRTGGAPWVATTVARRTLADEALQQLADLVRVHPRGVCVAGSGAGADGATLARFAAAAGWPVLADPLSGARSNAAAISTYEALLRHEPFSTTRHPDLVLRVGAPLTSKIANAWIADVPTILFDADDVWLDPDRTAAERVLADPEPVLEALATTLGTPAGTAWLDAWRAAEHLARAAIDRVLDADVACEARIARDIASALPSGGALVVASSMPVRALEWAMAPRADVRVLANRGANGIDGFVSTAVGVAAGHQGPTVALAGDLCFLHDTNGLLDAAGRAPVTFVVVDNAGGAIFSYLPQHELPEFERLFATPQGVDLVAVARAHGAGAERVAVGDVADAVADPASTPGVRALVVDVDRDKAREQHRRLWEAVATGLG